MFKNFLLKTMLKKQGVPEEQIDMIIVLMEKDPELFKRISMELKAKVEGGMDHVQASQEIMKKYEADIRKLMQS